MALTSQAVLRERLLVALLSLGGTANRAEVLNELDRQFGEEWSVDDRQPVTSRPFEVKWRNRASFERADMVRVGLLEDRSDGVWALTGFGVSAAEEHRGTDATEFDWPAIEWVKVPVDLKTGLPNGSPIAARHFADCDHWFRKDDGIWVGEPPFVASNEQTTSLPPCKDCVYRAEQTGNEMVGPRLAATDLVETIRESPIPMPVLLDIDETDVTATVRVRREQAHLRRHLFAGANEAQCALCGGVLPAALLVAAHIVPRRELNDAERLDFSSAAMLACALGCDALFELGYIVVGVSGLIRAGRAAATEALRASIVPLVGARCGAHNGLTAHNFARHLAMQNA